MSSERPRLLYTVCYCAFDSGEDAASRGSSQLGWDKMATSDSIESSLRILENVSHGTVA